VRGSILGGESLTPGEKKIPRARIFARGASQLGHQIRGFEKRVPKKLEKESGLSSELKTVR